MTTFGTRIPNGFNGSNMELIRNIFDMSAETIEYNKLYKGFTITLERSPLGEWRYTIEGEEA